MFPRSVPYEHNPPRRDNIVTVAMPGITSSRAQIARYTGPEDGVFVLQNWADGFEPLQQEDGGRNVHAHKSFLSILKHAVWLLFHLRDDEREQADSSKQDRCEATARKPRCDEGCASSYSPASASAGEAPSEPSCRPSAGAAPTAASGFPFPSPLATPPVLYYSRSRISCRLLHNVLPSPEVAEMVHRHWYCTLNPIHWLLVVKEIATCLWFAVRPIQLCYSELGRTNLAGTTDQHLFTREVQRAVELVQRQAAQCHAEELPTTTKTSGTGDEDANEPTAATCGEREEAAAAERQLTAGVPRPYHRPYLVLFGCSRGATTCFYASMKLPRSLARYVSLVIVEAPFDTLRHVIDSSSVFPNLNLWLFKAFCDYTNIENERSAYSYDPAQVELRCPIAFVISTRDKRVPNVCTQVLIDGVREQLVPHKVPAVEVLTLAHSRHPCMAVGHKDDQAAYVGFVEGLYDKYCSGVPPPLA